MDPPPSSSAAGQLQTIPTESSKVRLMCSYGGHIVPRPHRKSLFYAGGDTRIIALDRRTTGSSFAALKAHLSRTLFNNRPFHLKYQLPNEDLDSLVSVTTDEDLENMIEEHDRLSLVADPTPARIRLFLFPLKPESIGTALLDRKSDLWFSDALNNTGIIQRGQSTDTGLEHELLGLDSVGGSDVGNVVVGSGERKDVGGGSGVPESLILETSSSFGSTSSSVSMANSPAIGVHSEDNYVGLLEKKIRVPSSASIESDYSVGSATGQMKKITNQDTSVVQPSCNNDIVNPIFDQISSGYYISPQLGQTHQPYELAYPPQQAIPYMNQYATTGPLPPTSYYPVYQMPVHQHHHAQSPYLMNHQPYPVYLVPNVAVNQPSLHYQNSVVTPPAPEEVAVSSTTAAAPFGVAPTQQLPTQAKQQNVEPLDGAPSESVIASNVASEIDEDIAYTQIYKTQPSAPSLPQQYQSLVKGMKVLMTES